MKTLVLHTLAVLSIFYGHFVLQSLGKTDTLTLWSLFYLVGSGSTLMVLMLVGASFGKKYVPNLLFTAVLVSCGLLFTAFLMWFFTHVFDTNYKELTVRFANTTSISFGFIGAGLLWFSVFMDHKAKKRLSDVSNRYSHRAALMQSANGTVR